MSEILEFIDFLNSAGVDVRCNIMASVITSFKTGGNIDLIAYPDSVDKMITCVKGAKTHGFRFLVVGRGTNILISDSGYRGLIIKTDKLNNLTVEVDRGCGRILAECGASLTALSIKALKHSLTGLEFAYGIPGSVGGAVFMNAGAYGGEMADIIDYIECYSVSKDEIVRLEKDEIEFSYRYSKLMNKPDLVCINTAMTLEVGHYDSINSVMVANKTTRSEKQPLELPNAGSVFKRHPGYFIGQIVDEMGLKGYTIGGAQVSCKHAGFIVNVGGATTNDVLQLINYLSNKIRERHGFTPECEIRIIG